MPSTSASASASSQWANLSFVEVLEDLSSRFIVNLPSEELQRIERICFQVEQAHWFYEDFLRPLNSSLPSLNLRKFSIYILQTASLTVPLIRQYISSGSGSNNGATVQWEDLGGATYGLEAAFDEFLKYKTRVPVCGAVLLSDDWKSCLLVKGWKSSASWGFPKGKINQSESPRDCAIRETFEETGFDCSHLLPPDSPDWMELNVREQKMRLYIVCSVKKDTDFETKTRKEISKIDWFKLSDLPTWKQSKASGGGGFSSAKEGSKFYLVTPFIGKLKHWISENKRRVIAKQGHQVVSQIDSNDAAALSTESATNQASKITQPLGAPSAPAAMRTAGGVATSNASLLSSNSSQWPLDTGTLVGQGQHPQSVAPSATRETSDDSAALLNMLQQTLQLNPAQDSTPSTDSLGPVHDRIRSQESGSPLPAPRAQKSSGQTLKLLEMLSPNSPQATKIRPISEQPSTQLSADKNDSQSEDERNRKRSLLLQQLMSGAGSSSSPSAPAQTVQRSHQQAALLDLMHGVGSSAAIPPVLSPSQPSNNTSQQSALLGLLSPHNTHPSILPQSSAPSYTGGQQAYVPQAQPPTSHEPVDPGRNALLGLLNAGPRQPAHANPIETQSPMAHHFSPEGQHAQRLPPHPQHFNSSANGFFGGSPQPPPAQHPVSGQFAAASHPFGPPPHQQGHASGSFPPPPPPPPPGPGAGPAGFPSFQHFPGASAAAPSGPGLPFGLPLLQQQQQQYQQQQYYSQQPPLPPAPLQSPPAPHSAQAGGLLALLNGPAR